MSDTSLLSVVQEEKGQEYGASTPGLDVVVSPLLM